MTSDNHRHPDSHALDDWPICGPQYGRTAMLVLRLAHDHGMQLGEIEAVIIAALEGYVSKVLI